MLSQYHSLKAFPPLHFISQEIKVNASALAISKFSVCLVVLLQFQLVSTGLASVISIQGYCVYPEMSKFDYVLYHRFCGTELI